MGKRVLFLASRESSYSRVAHFADTLNGEYELDTCVSDEKYYSKRILNLMMKFFFLLSKQHYETVVIGFCAQILVFPVFLLFRGNLVIDGFVSLYDTLVLDRKRFKQEGYIAVLILWLERSILSFGDVITVDTEEHMQFYNQVLKVPINRIRVVRVSAQESEYSLVEQGALRRFQDHLFSCRITNFVRIVSMYKE